MRQFYSDNFNIRLADGLSNIHLTIPDEEASEALSYIKQFVQRSHDSTYLHRGYLPAHHLDALVRVRDASTNARQFGRAVEALGEDGDISQPAPYDEFTTVTIDPERDKLTVLNDAYYEVEADDAQKMVRTIQDLIRYNSTTLTLYLPTEIATQLPETVYSD